MEKIINNIINNRSFLLAWKIIWISLAVILFLFIGLVIYRIPAVIRQKEAQEAVERIHARKLTLSDVMGQNLPPEPHALLRDATVEGIDANDNGIRDDVELAIFRLHPDSARIRAAELQYAMDLQNELVNVFNSDTWVAAVKYEGGIGCLVDVSFAKYIDIKDQINKSDVWIKEVDELVFNSDLRVSRKAKIQTYETAYATGTKHCDVNLDMLPN